MTAWTNRKILLRDTGEYAYELRLPDFLASWDVWEYWEKPRFLSMESHLKKGDVLFDIGSESGWMSTIFGKYLVGGQNVCLFEPTPEFWPNIMQTWAENGLVNPKASFCGLVGNQIANDPRFQRDAWPSEAFVGKLSEARSYKYIHEHPTVPQLRIDDFVQSSQIIPRALTIDVEGAEELVLRGAENTLHDHKPLVWVSLHPDLMIKNYNSSAGALHAFMDFVGYKSEYISTDHEIHWLFEAK